MTEKNAESIGIMDPAFFVGKNILIKWVNDLLNINIQKVEEMATGAYYCQLLDMIYRDPPVVALSKVNFAAKYDYEYVKNWNVLQAVFTSQGVQKYVDVGKLVKAKYQDNLEFFQWFKSWFDSKYSGADYDPKAKRDAAIKSKGGKLPAPSAIAKPATKGIAKPSTTAPSKPAVVAKPIKPHTTPTTTAPTAKKTTTPTQPAKSASKTTSKSPSKDEKETDESTALAKLRATVEGLEKERNFYFGKLRGIEVICQQEEEKHAETKGKILQVLYSTDEEKDPAEPTETTESTDQVETGQTDDTQIAPTEEAQPENLLDTGVAEGDLLAVEETAF